jgi:hypothetical protein
MQKEVEAAAQKRRDAIHGFMPAFFFTAPSALKISLIPSFRIALPGDIPQQINLVSSRGIRENITFKDNNLWN